MRASQFRNARTRNAYMNPISSYFTDFLYFQTLLIVCIALSKRYSYVLRIMFAHYTLKTVRT